MIALSYMLNLNHLYYFYIAAENKTITNSARILGIAQPSLSSHIKLLESSLDRTLFRKSGRNVFLTLEGERLYKLCQPVFTGVAELERKMKQKNITHSFQLRIGFTEQIEGVFIEELVSHMLSFKKWPSRPKLIVTTGRKEQLVQSLKGHELDLAFSNTGTSDPEIVSIQQFQMPVGLYVSAKERKRNPKKSAREFLSDPNFGFAIPNFQLRHRHEIDDYLERENVKNLIFFDSDTLALVTRAVIDDVGMGFFPKPYMQEEESLKRVVCVSGKQPLWHHSLHLLSHLRFEQTPAIREMIASIRKQFSIVEHAESTK